MALQPIGLDATLTNVPDFTGGIDKMNKAVDGFTQNGQQAGGGFSKGFGEIVTGALREIGTLAVDALAKGGQAVAGFLKDSVGVAGDFQQEFAQFQIAVGHTIDGTGLKLDDFKKQFISLGKELPVSTQEVEQAAVEMARGGIDPAVIAAGGLRQTIQFASAALKGDLVSAAQISAKTMQAWTAITDSAATKTDFLTHAQNLMTQATTAASTTVDQLFLGLSNVGGTARLAGASFDETVKALAQLTPSFASSADAGTSLKTFFARLQPETKPAIAAMQDLGLWTEKSGSAFYDAQGNFVGMQTAEDLLQKATSGLTNAQREQALQTIFGNDAIRAAGVFATQGQAGYDALSASIAKQTTLTDAAAINQNTYNTAVENAKGSVEALQITVGSALLPVLTDLFNNTIAPAVNTLTDFASALFGDDEAFKKLDPTMQGMVTTIGVLISDVQEIVGAFNAGGASTAEFARRIDNLAGDLGAPAGLIENIVTEVQKLSKAFDAGGISGVIDQVLADITAAIPDIEKALLGWGQAFVDWVAPMIPPALKALADMASAGWDWVKGQAPEWGKQLLTWGDAFVTWIVPMIPPFLTELGKLGTQFLGWIGDQAAPLLAKFQDWATSFTAWVGPATVTFLKEWPGMLDKFLDWVGTSAGPILKQLGDWAVSFIAWVVPMIPGFLLEVGKIALAIGVFIGETAVVLNTKVLEWAVAMTEWVGTDAIPKLLKALGEMWSNINDWGLRVETDIGNLMVDVGSSLVQGIKRGVEDAWGSFVSWISEKVHSTVGAVMDAIGAHSPATEFMPVGEFAVQGIMQGFSDEWPGLLSQVGSLSDTLISKMQDIGGQIQSAIADSFGATASIDRQVAKNLDKFKDVLPQYAQYTQGALQEAQNQAQGFLDPAEGAKFFKMRSDQILEYAKLQKDLDNAASQEDKDRITKQMQLINQAQTAEISQFDATKAATSPLLDIANQINDVLKVIAGINLTDDQIKIVSQLSGVWAALQSPVNTRAQQYANPTTTSTSTTNLNMPIYTNQSPTVLQSSLAIAGAALP